MQKAKQPPLDTRCAPAHPKGARIGITPKPLNWRLFLIIVGTWLSLVEHSRGVRGGGRSNRPVPTIPCDSVAAIRTSKEVISVESARLFAEN